MKRVESTPPKTHLITPHPEKFKGKRRLLFCRFKKNIGMHCMQELFFPLGELRWDSLFWMFSFLSPKRA